MCFNTDNFTNYNTTPTDPNPAYARHLGGSDILFADGHVKFFVQGSLAKDPSRASQANDRDRWKIPMRPQDDRIK